MTIHPSGPRGLRPGFWLVLSLAGIAAAQDQNPPAPEQKPSVKISMPTTPKGPFVRKFSMGASFSFLAQTSIPDASMTQTVSDELYIESWADSKRRLFGGGIIFQTTLTPRLALASGVMFRRLDFTTTAITYEGVDDEDTTDVDERTATMKEETTRARLLDVPVLLRYYNKDHSRRGRRYFYEGGMTMRYAHDIHSFGQTTDQSGIETCCDESSLKPAHRVLPGIVVGAGMQFIDEFGIRFVPEVRYTHWMGRTFDSMPARSRTDQIEFGFSVTF